MREKISSRSKGFNAILTKPGIYYTLILIFLFLAAMLFPVGVSTRKALAATGEMAEGSTDSPGNPVSIAAAPIVSGVSPSGASVGAEVTISGSGFGASQGSFYVSFGSIKATQYTSWSNIQIKCEAPPGIYGRVSLTVTTTDGISNAYQFSVVPIIDDIDPEIGPIGSETTLYGSGFEPNQGNGYVSFGSVKVSEYALWSDTEITVKVPRGVPEEVAVKVVTNGSLSSNSVNFEVVSYAVAFAEGYTGSGFQEFLCIGNTQPYPISVDIIFLFPSGEYLDESLTVGANCRATVDVNSLVGPGEEVSAVVYSDLEAVVERPMYFNYNNRWTGGHDVIGTPYASKLWFFAEGYTGPGFEEWVCVLNTSEDAANLKFHFQVKGAGEIVKTASVPGMSRRSFKVNDLLGTNYQCSLALESDQFVVAERPMYFDYLGTGARHWEGGHCVMGLPFLSNEYYFAEGTTRGGFEEWLTLQNPNDEPITVIAAYQLGAGQGDPVQVSHVVPGNSRETVYVAGDVGAEKDVSIKLASGSYFLAERPMYFRYTGYGANWEGGHCVIGAVEPSSEWFFAEGYTGNGFQEWLCLQNPGDQDSTVEINYLGNGGSIAVKPLVVPAKTRRTLRVNDEAGPGLEVSCRLRVTSGSPVVVERPMYFIFRGWDGGHDVVGYYPLELDAGSASGYRDAGLEQGTLLRDLPLRLGEERER